MRTAYRSMLRTALVALVATGMAVVATPQTATALPGDCTHTWDDGFGDDLWGTAANWDVDQAPGSSAVACIGAFTVVVNGLRNVGALHMDGSALLVLNPGTCCSSADRRRRSGRVGARSTCGVPWAAPG